MLQINFERKIDKQGRILLPVYLISEIFRCSEIKGNRLISYINTEKNALCVTSKIENGGSIVCYDKQGRIAIPSKIRNILGLKSGDIMSIKFEKGEFILNKIID